MKKYLVDLSERVAATAAFTFLSVFTVTDLSTAKDAGVAAAAAALTLVKGALAGYVSGGDKAGLTSSK
jgi:hypothetical protein